MTLLPQLAFTTHITSGRIQGLGSQAKLNEEGTEVIHWFSALTPPGDAKFYRLAGTRESVLQQVSRVSRHDFCQKVATKFIFGPHLNRYTGDFVLHCHILKL